MGKGNAKIGKMAVILRETHLDTRIKICILMNLIVPQLVYAGEVWKGNAKSAKNVEIVQMTATKKIRGCSKTTRSAALRTGLGIYPPGTSRDMTGLKWQKNVRNIASSIGK